jgi:lysophospholipase L1-like esterase
MNLGRHLTLLAALCPAVLPAASRTARGDEPKAKPVVVLVGDSIRIGYAPVVAEKLKGLAEVVSPAENGGDSGNVLKHLDEWVIRHDPAVVHFNAGLHDLKTDPKTGAKQVGPDDYKKNLAEIVRRLERETSARLVFATTTPVIDERTRNKNPFVRNEADVEAYNRAAREVVASSPAVVVDDLHATVMGLGPASALVADGVHFTPEARQAQGEQVARVVREAIEGPPVDREVACRWAPAPPTIDGRLDDPAWEAAAVIEHFPAFWRGADTGRGTRARLLWDKDALYFAATMTDAELRSFGTKRNDTLWKGDVFELFFKPFEDRPAYYEFQVNPKSVILELPFTRRGEDFATVAAKPTLGMTAVARAEGTVDQPGDRDGGWSVEGRIPWSAFAPTGGRPEPGAAWRFALCRYDYGPEGTQPLTMSSAPLRRMSFHRYEDYGRLRFEGPSR